MVRIFFILISCSITWIYSVPAFSQRGEIGLGVGATNYKGDLATYPKLLATRIGGELFYRYNFTDAISWRTGLMLGLFQGDDSFSENAPYQLERAFSFEGIGLELHSVLEYHFFNFRGRKDFPKYSPYLFGGIGIARFNMERTPEPADEEPEPPFLNIVLPYGVGIKTILSSRYILALEYGTRQLFNDLFDLTTDFDGATKFNRGNTENNDKYYFLSLSLSYRFNAVKCPDPMPRRIRIK